jgi:hypothetical protein
LAPSAESLQLLQLRKGQGLLPLLQCLPLQGPMLQALRSLRLSRLQRMLRSAQVAVRALSPWLMRALTP